MRSLAPSPFLPSYRSEIAGGEGGQSGAAQDFPPKTESDLERPLGGVLGVWSRGSGGTTHGCHLGGCIYRSSEPSHCVLLRAHVCLCLSSASVEKTRVHLDLWLLRDQATGVMESLSQSTPGPLWTFPGLPGSTLSVWMPSWSYPLGDRGAPAGTCPRTGRLLQVLAGQADALLLNWQIPTSCPAEAFPAPTVMPLCLGSTGGLLPEAISLAPGRVFSEYCVFLCLCMFYYVCFHLVCTKLPLGLWTGERQHRSLHLYFLNATEIPLELGRDEGRLVSQCWYVKERRAPG